MKTYKVISLCLLCTRSSRSAEKSQSILKRHAHAARGGDVKMMHFDSQMKSVMKEAAIYVLVRLSSPSSPSR